MTPRDSAAPAAGALRALPHAAVVRQRAGSWWWHWGGISLAAALIVVAVDALLLQERRSFFTGGFLAADHLTSPAQALVFLAAALAANVALLGAIVAIALWASARAGLNRNAAFAAAAGCALVPVAVVTLVQYQLLAYLGDLFDIGLMFDLAGRSTGEVLAVAWPQILRVGLLTLSLAAAVGGGVWILRRRGGPRLPQIGFGRAATAAGILLVCGAGVTLAARGSSDVLDNGLRRTAAGRFLGALVNVASDVDRDGYGMLGRPPDPDLLDAGVRPYALDIPGNGVDENGVGGDLPASLPGYAEHAEFDSPWRISPDVVLIVLESFRADALDAVAGGRPVTPVLSSLAARGIGARLAYSHNGYTVQSRRHIFSGSTAGFDPGTTLVDDFNARGYETAYFSAQDESFGGPDQGVGFDRADVAYDARDDRDRRYSTFTTAGSLAVPHDVLAERVTEFLRRRDSGRPLFLYVNLHDTHFPYHHSGVEPITGHTVLPQSELSPSRGEDLRAMYLNTAANVDRAIGQVLDEVTRTLGHEPGVIVTADHGESLFDEGFLGHGYALNDAQTRIPLVVANLPLRIVEPFGQSDLRRAIHEAFAHSGEVSGRPELALDSGKRVFQYLGNIDRPAAIGFVSGDGRLVYDMRARMAQVDGTWRADDALTAGERSAVSELIHTWELMMNARNR